ncbi:histidine kinase [Pendulispora rubella]|uniref:Histidine kinase n=1 Tax=Pendulispora rubella TaxID=2741070 RepID=A0ABZ2LHQ7_9BACT
MTRRRQRWFGAGAASLFLLVLWLAPFLFSSPQGFVSAAQRHAAIVRSIIWVLQIPVTIACLSLHHEWAVRHGASTAKSVITSLALAISIGFFWGALINVVVDPQLPAGMDRYDLGRTAMSGIFSGFLHSGVWAFGFVYVFAAEDARMRALEREAHKSEAARFAAEAEQLRATAELARLRSQLEPHFLLNTLNAISGLVTRSPKEARRLIGCLGDLLADSLRDADGMQTLDQEMQWLHRYAEILESRHANALRFHWIVSDATRQILIPRLLLQPLVENAVHHGALRRAGGGEVTVRVELERRADIDDVVCTIEDNGPGLSTDPTRPGAFGIHSVRRRLALEYRDANLHLESTGRGTRAIVRFPREAMRKAAEMGVTA